MFNKRGTHWIICSNIFCYLFFVLGNRSEQTFTDKHKKKGQIPGWVYKWNIQKLEEKKILVTLWMYENNSDIKSASTPAIFIALIQHNLTGDSR